MDLRPSKSPKKPLRSELVSRRSSHLVQKSERSSFIQPWEIEDLSYEEEMSKRGTKTQLTNKNDNKEKEVTTLSTAISQRNIQEPVSNRKESPTRKERKSAKNKIKKTARTSDETARDQQMQKSHLDTKSVSEDIAQGTSIKKKKEDSHISHNKNTSRSISKNTNSEPKPIDMFAMNKLSEKNFSESDNYLLSGLKHYLSEKKYPIEIPLGVTKFPILPESDPASLGIPKFKVGLSAKIPLQRPTNDESQTRQEFSSNNVSTRIRAIDNSMNIAFKNENRESRRFLSVQKNSAKANAHLLNETPEIQKLLKGYSNFTDSKIDLSGYKSNEVNSLRYPVKETSSTNFLYDLEDRKKSIKEKVSPTILGDPTLLSSSQINYDLLVGLISPVTIEQTNCEKAVSLRDNHFLMKVNDKKESPEWIKSFKSPSKGFTFTYRRGKRMRKALDMKDGTNSRSISQANEQSSLPSLEPSKKINMQNVIEKAMRDREKQNNGISWETDSKFIKDIAMGSRLKETPLLKLLQKQMESQDKDDVIAPKKPVSLAPSPKFTNLVSERLGGKSGDNVLLKPFNLKDIYTTEHGLVSKKAKPLFHLAQSPSNPKTVRSELRLKHTQVKKGAAIF